MTQHQTPRWYCLSIDGAATLCIDQADAVETALDADIAFPNCAPHRVVQMVELLRKDMAEVLAAEQADRYGDGPWMPAFAAADDVGRDWE